MRNKVRPVYSTLKKVLLGFYFSPSYADRKINAKVFQSRKFESTEKDFGKVSILSVKTIHKSRRKPSV